jgi:hypothetical protein
LAIGGRDMVRQPLSGKAIANESKYPYIVELSIADDKLDVEFSRRVMDFHTQRKIQVRHGRRIVLEGQIYFRWCFSDLVTASAFMEEFGGKLTRSGQPERRSR